MQAIIESFGIPFAEFRKLIQEHICLVAGNCALQGFLTQEEMVTSDVNTIDIWLYPNPSKICNCIGCIRNSFIKNKGNPLHTFIEFFGKYGMKYSSKMDSPSITTPLIPYVDSILSFTGPTGKEIQLFSILHSNPLHLLQYTFDLSIYCSWWDADGNIFYTMNPTMTCNMKMYFIDDDIILERADKRVIDRVESFKKLGFVLCDGPCEYIREPDARNISESSGLCDIIAFDVISFDEHCAVDFLRESEWNILVKCGEKWCGYNRKVLTNYMHTRTTSVDTRCSVADTPMNQSIAIEAISSFMKSDYSIYELVHKSDITFGYNNSIHKSIYNVKCYTISGWEGKTPLVEFSPKLFGESVQSYPEEDEAYIRFLQENSFYLQENYPYEEYTDYGMQMDEEEIQEVEVDV